MDRNDERKINRWRLILGNESTQKFEDMLGDKIKLSSDEQILDSALSAIYDNSSDNLDVYGNKKSKSSIKISRWLGDIRTLFEKEIVTIIQNDAIEKRGLKELLFEEEILNNLEPDINLAATMLMIKDYIPKRSKENVRVFIGKIISQINSLLENDIKSAVKSALNKKQHSPIPSATALDYKYTINKNLKNYNTTLKTIIPERCYFYDRASRSNSWTVIVDIDQSGSMGESVIYSSIVACILASMDSIKTRIVAFDTEIVDLTYKSDDPIDMLFGIQLGGGTDINKSVAYCQQFIENPKKTLFFIISDLEENGNRAGLLRRIEEIRSSGVTVVCLLALADGGKPYYDTYMAQKISSLDIPCFACTPTLLPQLLERALKGYELKSYFKNL